ncbi:hypothetical protein [Streptomyces sp. Isolate_45]|nr:hypothetical protein [Streptomyces sp. Isolate_45]MDA5284310.1 hypothetical protein [Streptomyces sp. Isolate_45]
MRTSDYYKMYPGKASSDLHDLAGHDGGPARRDIDLNDDVSSVVLSD